MFRRFRYASPDTVANPNHYADPYTHAYRDTVADSNSNTDTDSHSHADA